MRRSHCRTTFSLSFRALVFLFVLLCLLTLLAPRAMARTYVITDGDRVVTYTTFATDPTAVLSEAGLTLSENDTFTTEDGSAITIRRAAEVTVLYHGEETTVTSDGETVGQLLARLGIDLTSTDVVSHDPAEPVSEGMEITVDSVITCQEVYTTTLPHETKICGDASLMEGTEEVLIEGRDGELTCTASVTYINGKESHRETISENMTIAPITEIIAQGTAKPEFEPETGEMPVIKDGYIIMPSGEMLTYYKKDYVTATGYTHTDAGCDMITSTGTIVHYGTVAVDPRFIPYGTRMLIVSHDGERYYGIATAEDCGGAIKRDKMDLYFPTYQECIEFGRRRCTIYFLE